MGDEFKICPECGAEYYPHIVKCAGCEVELIFPGQKPAKNEAASEGTIVCVEEGDHEVITNLSNALSKLGFPTTVLKAKPGSSCSSKGEYGLYVDGGIARETVRQIEGLWDKLYPELKTSATRMDAGQCPACGSETKGLAECPDCGLFLGGHGGDGCNSCGPC